MKGSREIGLKITRNMREYYRYTGVSAETKNAASALRIRSVSPG